MGRALTLPLAAALAGTAPASALPALAPDDFRSLALTSVSVLKTQREYLRDFAEERPGGPARFFFYFDLRYALPETDQARVAVPAAIGDMRGELSEGRLGVCALLLAGDYAFGFYDIAERFGITAPRDLNPGYGRYYGNGPSPEADGLAWSQGYQNFAFTLERRNRFRVALGLFDRDEPIVEGTGAGARFALKPGPDSASAWTGTRDRPQGFFDADIGGYGFSSLYTLGHSLDLIGFRKRWARGEAEISPAAHYYRFRRRIQIGAEARGWTVLDALSLSGEAYADSREAADGGRSLFGHGSASAACRLWPPTDPGPRRFRAKATASGGWSNDAVGKGAWGHSEGLAFERLFGVVGFACERSFDDPRTLERMPLAGAAIWNFDFEIAW